MTFSQFFKAATEHPPYDYQCRLACGPEARAEQSKNLEGGCTCESKLIDVPTGLGETAAVVLAWLWNRRQLQEPKWPRRLV